MELYKTGLPLGKFSAPQGPKTCSSPDVVRKQRGARVGVAVKVQDGLELCILNSHIRRLKKTGKMQWKA